MIAVRALVVILGALLAGCASDGDAVEDKVFQQALSPDGAWLAQAVDEHQFGPGNAAHSILVTLKGTGRKAVFYDNKPEQILELEPNPKELYPGHPTNHLSMVWQSPTQLLLRYHDATADFVVAQIAGVDIITKAV